MGDFKLYPPYEVLIYSPIEADAREEYLDAAQVRLNYTYQNVTAACNGSSLHNMYRYIYVYIYT